MTEHLRYFFHLDSNLDIRYNAYSFLQIIVRLYRNLPH
jgi:hypothetical protein